VKVKFQYFLIYFGLTCKIDENTKFVGHFNLCQSVPIKVKLYKQQMAWNHCFTLRFSYNLGSLFGFQKVCRRTTRGDIKYNDPLAETRVVIMKSNLLEQYKTVLYKLWSYNLVLQDLLEINK
jgi:hypothetical protein